MQKIKYIHFFVIFFYLLLTSRILYPFPGLDKHALYIGFVQIDHYDHSKVAQMRIKVFSDDLQSALKNSYKSFRFTKPEQLCITRGDLLGRYFSAHLAIQINDSRQKLELADCQIQGDVTLLDFTVTAPAHWRTIEVETDFFQELFPAQTNVFQISYQDKRHFFRLNSANKRKALSL